MARFNTLSCVSTPLNPISRRPMPAYERLASNTSNTTVEVTDYNTEYSKLYILLQKIEVRFDTKITFKKVTEK